MPIPANDDLYYKVRPHLNHVDCLEVAWQGDHDNGDPDVVVVECTKCGVVVHELYDRDTDQEEQNAAAETPEQEGDFRTGTPTPAP